MIDKFKGTMIGSALGDAIGELVLYLHSEGVAKHKIDHSITIKSILASIKETDQLKYTDDTAMAIGIAESLCGTDYINDDHITERFCANYNYNPGRGYGPNTETILCMINELHTTRQEATEKVNKLFHKADHTGEGSCGNGAAMRINPAGIFFHDSSDIDFYKSISIISKITHLHPVGVDGACVLAKAVSIAAKSVSIDPQAFIQQLIDFSQTKTIRKKMIKIKKLIKRNISYDRAAKILGRSVAVHESMPFAIYSFLKNTESYIDCLFAAILNGGDADTVGAMACGISGAYLGIESIPKEWINKLEDSEYISALSIKLYNNKTKSDQRTFEQWRAEIQLDQDEELEEL